jgi:HTH-type transcriptional regulator / antitoxin HigA
MRKNKKTRTKKKPGEDRFLELVQYVPLRPVRSERELDEAINMVNYLIEREKLNAAEKDYLDVLADLIEKFESVHYPFEPVSDSDMLKHLIEAKGGTQAQVAKACQIAESTISELLAGTRQLSRKHIGKLCRYFHVSPGVFNFDG